ncbi:regulatory protein, luxR family [Mycolicibacterium rutilum]|uniref:Regulatory protein, luxR family n=1 Tax=Mycolicibacterium rutilum TaxID=370526 RepID=A0A1H6IRR3_MYCRU|nr:LuxR family transcriptional regulator [Mycolicibacterium rutilum]SEH49336.1 regulatory protein, luxR family [Mycolicibacterium rutilum]
MIRQWPLVGRSEELAVIAEATRSVGDRARGVVLSGAAGVGKTRVAFEALSRCGPRAARRHWIVGTASSRSVPLGAFVEIASEFGPDPLRRVREVIDGLIGDAPFGEVVVGVDDAHLLDDVSAFTVHQLVTRRLATVILTIRSGETPPDAITAIWKDQHLDRLELQPLSPSELGRLVEQALDGPVDSFSADRFWQYTQGNTLYLRHLLDHEVDAGRVTRHSGVWRWDGQPSLSPTLTELLESRIAQAPATVRDVLDALAVAEPLESDVLEAIADADALAEAESLGLISVDCTARPASVRLAHPLLGEIRHTGSLRLRRVSGRIAAELARKGSTDPRALIRRAVLTLESDLTPDSEFLLAAASAAMQLLDHRLAEHLAERAVAVGGGPWAKIARAMAITWQERGVEAEAVLAEQADQASGLERTQIAILRAMNFTLILGEVARAEAELELLPADDVSAQAIATALRPLIQLVRGHSREAVAMADVAAAQSPGSDVATIFLAWVYVTGLGDLGRIDEIEAAAKEGYAVADRSPESGHLLRRLALQETHGYRLGGMLAESDAVIDRIRRDTLDVPFEESWHRVMVGLSAMSRGALDDARRSLRDALAYLGTGDNGRMVKTFGRTWLATVTAMLGRAQDARRELEALEWWARDPQACMFDPYRSLAEAWVCAAEGACSEAVSLMRRAAQREVELDRPAWQVVLLQTATQFGDHTTADRLAELAATVQGPRAPAAAAHAAALAARDGDALLEASHRYESFEDRVAAADAAAQAVLAYQGAGLRGAAMTASAVAERLADECGGALTPALSSVTTPQPFTARQREIISLAAQGLSNKEIAERLTMSVRSVEGHLFRASQRVGANSRDQLIAILTGT